METKEAAPQENPNSRNIRGNKKLRLIVIAVLIIVAVYLLYSVW